MYTSRATELGRGTKIQRLTDAPIWTPAPGHYTMKTDFINQTAIEEAKKAGEPKPEPQLDEDGNPIEEEVKAPWNQKGFR